MVAAMGFTSQENMSVYTWPMVVNNLRYQEALIQTLVIHGSPICCSFNAATFSSSHSKQAYNNATLGLYIYTKPAHSTIYRAMLRRARLCHSKSSDCLSVCDVDVWFSHRLEYFENNFTAEYLKASARADLNMAICMEQQEQIRVE